MADSPKEEIEEKEETETEQKRDASPVIELVTSLVTAKAEEDPDLETDTEEMAAETAVETATDPIAEADLQQEEEIVTEEIGEDLETLEIETTADLIEITDTEAVVEIETTATVTMTDAIEEETLETEMIQLTLRTAEEWTAETEETDPDLQSSPDLTLDLLTDLKVPEVAEASIEMTMSTPRSNSTLHAHIPPDSIRLPDLLDQRESNLLKSISTMQTLRSNKSMTKDLSNRQQSEPEISVDVNSKIMEMNEV